MATDPATPSPKHAPLAPPHFHHDVKCPDCGYNLRGTVSERCPECGLNFDELTRTPAIPWERRHTAGRFATFWHTIALIIMRPRTFGCATFRPVDYRSARAFHLAIWLCIVLSALIAFSAFALLGGLDDLQQEFGIFPAVTASACWLLTAYLLLGVGSYFFHPRQLSVQQQNNAVALSYYANAPVALLPWITLFGVGLLTTGPLPRDPLIAAGLGLSTLLLLTAWLRRGSRDDTLTRHRWSVRTTPVLLCAASVLSATAVPGDPYSLSLITACVAAVALLTMTGIEYGKLVEHVIPAGRRLRVTLLLPLAWFAVFFLFGVLLPAVLLFAHLAYLSLQPLPLE